MNRKTAYSLAILFSFVSIVQAQKGNITLSPQVFVQQLSSTTYNKFGVATSIHYNVGNYVAIGGIIIADAYISIPKAVNYYKAKYFTFTFIPEVQINFSNKKIIPFVKLQAFDGHYYYMVANSDNPHIPPKQQKIREFFRNYIRPINFSASVGMNYKLTDRLKGTGMINFRTTQSGKFFNEINVGLGIQYDIRHKE